MKDHLKMASISILLLLTLVIFALVITLSSGKPTAVIESNTVYTEKLTIETKRNMFKKNKNTSNDFKCAPRPRSFSSTSLIKGINASTTIFPNNYVLYRCDSQSGCCTEANQVCSVRTQTNVTLVFALYNGLHKAKGLDYKIETVTNHTECECVKSVQ